MMRNWITFSGEIFAAAAWSISAAAISLPARATVWQAVGHPSENALALAWRRAG